MRQAALLSVSDRTGIGQFARDLNELGFLLLTTGGTGKYLTDEKIQNTPIEEYTSQKEILDGRVKTLHPRIHAGILARRDNASHMTQLSEDQIAPIDIVAVNLYPFSSKVRGKAAQSPAQMIEYIDVGGPTMLRAAAKNFKSVFVICDPADYPRVIQCFHAKQQESDQGLELRRELALKVFSLLARDNAEVASYLNGLEVKAGEGLTRTKDEPVVEAGAATLGLLLKRDQTLRYGENPAQKAWSYVPWNGSKRSWKQLSGKELSYNNLLDCDAAFRLIRDFDKSPPFAFIIKHLNPCGAALGKTPLEALTRAKLCDPRSHFGGIIGFNQQVSADVANNIREDFAEIVVAPSFASDALETLKRNKNLRLIQFSLDQPGEGIELRSIEGGYLMQQQDGGSSALALSERATGPELTTARAEDLEFAWKICAHVKSNAIVLAKNGMLVGVGAGQMSRIDSVELAISKATTHAHQLSGSVCASDAFFPFADSVERLSAAGVTAIIAPSGAKRDAEVVELAAKLGLSLFFTKDRHFRH